MLKASRMVCPALLALLAVPSRAAVREISSMSELLPELSTGTLLVFDIDNTLIEPAGNAGSDQWYYYLQKAFRRDGLDPKQAEAKAAESWTRALDVVEPKAVEALTPGLIRVQQERGISVMALTARGPEDAPATFRQLSAIGVDLGARAPSALVLRGSAAGLPEGRAGLYENGVLFVGEGPEKGKALAAFLGKLGLRPARVVFVDDKPHHARNVDAALASAGIPGAAFRYGAADAKVRAFNTGGLYGFELREAPGLIQIILTNYDAL